MKVKINNKTYDTDTMTPQAIELLNKTAMLTNQIEALNVSKQVYTNNLVALLEANKPIEDDVQEAHPDEGE